MKLFIYTLAVLSSLQLRANDVVEYRVKKGDTLSDILFKLNIGPIYGPKGFQEFSVKTNKLKRRGDKIRVGDVLIFPVSPVDRVVSSEAPPAPSEAPPDDPSQHHSFLVSPQVSWINFLSESKDAFQHNDLKAYSRPVPGAHLQYGLQWDENWSFLFFSSFSKVSFYPDDVFTYNRSDVSRNNYGFGVSYRAGSTEWGSRLGFYDQLFFSLPSTSEIDVDVVALPEFHLSYRRAVKQYKKMSFKVGLNGKAILPYQTPKIKGELGYGGGLDFLVGSAHKNLRLFLNHSQANASDNKTTASEVGLGFVMEGNFDD